MVSWPLHSSMEEKVVECGCSRPHCKCNSCHHMRAGAEEIESYIGEMRKKIMEYKRR